MREHPPRFWIHVEPYREIRPGPELPHWVYQGQFAQPARAYEQPASEPLARPAPSTFHGMPGPAPRLEDRIVLDVAQETGEQDAALNAVVPAYKESLPMAEIFNLVRRAARREAAAQEIADAIDEVAGRSSADPFREPPPSDMLFGNRGPFEQPPDDPFDNAGSWPE